MPLKIKKIRKNSLAADFGLRAGDLILKINGHSIDDFLDFQFYGSDDLLNFQIRDKNGNVKYLFIRKDWETELGIELQEHRCRTCINNCIFCFIDQMHPNLRKSLYVKDGDYRFSFVFGNFITLTNLTERDYQKIFAKKLSPLYISVHTTNPILHKKMLRYKINFDIMEKLRYLSENGIEFHTQIVVVPGWNDKTELANTLSDLSDKNLNVLSVGIVPVGLTKFRTNLLDIKRIDSRAAREILTLSGNFPNTYCADEIYLLAEAEIPPEDFYDNYPQLENGIGMIRLLLENWKESKSDFIADIEKLSQKVVFVTGTLAYKFINIISKEINKNLPNKTRVVKIENDFFGKEVTVGGLLTAKDILSQVGLRKNEILAVSSNIFNTDGFTLDNVHKNDLKKDVNDKLLIIDEEFDDWNLL